MLQQFHNPRKLAEPQVHERVMSPCPFRNRLYVGLIAFNSSSPILMLASSSTASNLVMTSTGALRNPPGCDFPKAKPKSYYKRIGPRSKSICSLIRQMRPRLTLSDLAEQSSCRLSTFRSEGV